MIIIYMAAGIFCGIIAATVTFSTGAGFAFALLAYALGGTAGMIGSVLLSLMAHGSDDPVELATTN